MTQEELAAVFMPHVIEHVQSLRKGQRLVHYTSAEAGCRIISGQEVWLRNSLLMNDFSEIEHGMACLRQAWASPTGNQLQQWLDRVEQGLAGRIVGLFDSHVDGLKAATFMMSLSRHEDDEDQLGRLSMWRAYGGKSGVALVLRPDIFVSTTDKLKVYSSPVRYLSAPDFLAAFDSWANGLIGRYEEICRIDKDLLTGFFFLSLRVFVLCTKHPGFKEEKEWRIFHSPLLDGNSKWLKKENEIIGGIPQEVVKISLENDDELGIAGMSPETLIDRVIIGPSQHPVPIYHALYSALANAGIPNPGERLWISHIPLRQ